jgi:hypothetical protein
MLRELDAGTFGSVWEGVWRGLQVAVKVINYPYSPDALSLPFSLNFTASH